MHCADDADDPDDARHVDRASTSEFHDPLRPQNNDRSRHDLCSVCSQNQLLKVKQLANFVPQNEV